LARPTVDEQQQGLWLIRFVINPNHQTPQAIVDGAPTVLPGEGKPCFFGKIGIPMRGSAAKQESSSEIDNEPSKCEQGISRHLAGGCAKVILISTAALSG
jgi:hypothetical protein